ncbi:MAG: hypothetical protein HY647_06465 [Acidobacteria bacterium]|nr:hypothetical protein [Acidobacteriota bacterium]
MQFTLLSAGMTVWGAVTAALVVLLIYRAVLGIHEEDQLFLDRAEAALEREQAENIARINRIDPIVKGLAILSVVLLVIIGGVWIYRGLYGPVTF